MTESSIQPIQPGSSALSAEHYQTFEMAKENDGILGGSDIAQIRSYAAYARAQAQAIHKTIAATSGIEDVAAIKAEATETAQTFAKVGIYADQRIGEILRELPTRQGRRTDTTLSHAGEEVTKADALQNAGISRSEAYRLEELASNPEVVQAVLDKAEAEGRIPSRKQVLDAIKERDAARAEVATVRAVGDQLKRQRDEAREDAEGYAEDIKDLQAEVAALEKQSDRAYEDGYKAAQKQQGQQMQVVERKVEVPSAADQRRIKELEHLEQLHSDDNAKLRRKLEETRRELDRAKGILGMNQTMQDVRRDVQYLISATNQYVRQYGGLTWTAASLEQVDEPTREELKKAATNLATFATALVASLEGIQ